MSKIIKYKVGDTFGIYKIIKKLEPLQRIIKNRIITIRQFELQCKCGLIKIGDAATLRYHSNQSCGILCSLRYENLINKKIGSRVVIDGPKIATNKKNEKYRMWFIRCDCGVKRWIGEDKLKQTKSCGNCNRFKLVELTKGKISHNQMPLGEAAKNSLYASYKSRAKIKNIVFELTKEVFMSITSQKCHYCGIEPYKLFPINNTKKLKNGKIKKNLNGQYTYNGIDRIDSSIGYILGNCIPCCSECNYMKQETPYSEFLKQILQICINLKLKIT